MKMIFLYFFFLSFPFYIQYVFAQSCSLTTSSPTAVCNICSTSPTVYVGSTASGSTLTMGATAAPSTNTITIGGTGTTVSMTAPPSISIGGAASSTTTIGSTAAPSTSTLTLGGSGTNVTIGNNLHVSGIYQTNKPVYLDLYGSPTFYKSDGSTPATLIGGFYAYFLLPSNNGQNWSPTYTNNFKLNFPYNGLYIVKFAYNSNADTICFISKNVANANDLNVANYQLLGLAAAQQATITSITYFTTSDFAAFGCYVSTGTMSASTRTTISVALMQKTP